MTTPTLTRMTLSALIALLLASLPLAAPRAEPCDLDLATLGTPTLRCTLHEADPLVSALNGSSVPGRFNFQARLSQAKLLLGDRVIPQLQVKIQDLKGQTLCAFERSDVVIDDSVLNLELREEVMGGCKLAPLLARHAQLKVQVCFGAQTCLRPLKLSAAPYALKSEYSYWALRAERVERASISHYTSRLTADRDHLNTARRALDQNLTGEFVVDASAPLSVNNPETGSRYEVSAQATTGALLWSPTSQGSSQLHLASKDHQRDALRRLNRLSFVANKGLIAGRLSIDGLPSLSNAQGARRDGLQLVQGDLYLKNPLTIGERLVVRGADLNQAHPLPLSELTRQVEGDVSPSALEAQYALSLSDHNSPTALSRAARLRVEGDTALNGALWLGQSLTASSGMSVVGGVVIEGRLSSGPLEVQGGARGANPSLSLTTGPSASPSLEMSSLSVGPSASAEPTPLTLTQGALKVAGAASVTGDSRLSRSLSLTEGARFSTERLSIQVRENPTGGSAADLAPAQQSELLASAGNTLYVNGEETKLIVRGQTRIMGEVEFRQPPVMNGGCRLQIPPDQQGLAISQVERFSLVCGERSVTLRPFRCGNSVVDPGEQCDRGDVRDGDGCSSHCLCEPENLIDGVYYPPTDASQPLIPCSGDSCGNGVIDPGETCDDPLDESCVRCQRSICGDGVLSVGESCDDGNTNNNDGCSSTCTFERRRLSFVEDTPAPFTLLDNLTDSQGRNLSYRCVVPQGDLEKPNGGGDFVVVNEGLLLAPTYTNSVRYHPTLNANSDPNVPNQSVTYPVSCTLTPGGDQNALAAQGGAEDRSLTGLIYIEPVNDAPIAVADTLTVNEDTPGNVSVLANDEDVDLDVLSLTSCTQGAKGDVTRSGGLVTYTPHLNVNGADSFSCTISDGNGGTGTSTVTVTITPVNDAPNAVNDTLTTSEDTPNTVNVLSNDTDVEGDTLSLTSCGDGAKGSTTEAGGVVTYTPSLNANGADSFSCTISDGNGGTGTSTVTVTITPVNDAPNAVNDTLTTSEDTPNTVNVLSNDTDVEGDTLSLTSCGDGAKGSTTEAGGVVTYTPSLNVNGADSFSCTISDGNGGTGTSTVTVSITPVNDAPNAVNDTLTTSEDTPNTVNVLSNDTDVEGDALTLTSCGDGTKGTTTELNGVVTYTPNADENGADSFSCTISDGNGGIGTSAVNVSITPVNDAPNAVNDTLTTSEDTPNTVNVLSNDTDVDGDTLTLTSCGDGAKGSTTEAGGVVTYTPSLNANGADSFSCTISDGNGGTGTSTVTVSITPVNDAPTAVDDTLAATTATAATVDVVNNDSDPDGDTVSLVSCTNPTNGTISVNVNNGRVTYTSNAAFTGVDTFTCTIEDPSNAQSSATVTVTVSAP